MYLIEFHFTFWVEVMKLYNHQNSCGTLSIALLLGVMTFSASAAVRDFSPEIRTKNQKIDHLNKMTIISAKANSFEAGASFLPDTLKQGWLVISVKNNTMAPVQLFEDYLEVRTAEGSLESFTQKRLDEKAYMKVQRDKINCNNGTASKAFTCAALKDTVDDKHQIISDDLMTSKSLAVGEVRVSQIKIDLPKKSQSQLAEIQVQIKFQGETLTLVFIEAK